MRFVTAWATISSQNVTLRGVTLTLGVVCAILGFSTAKLSMRKPLIIERACFSQLQDVASDLHPQTEIEGFLREAIPARFNTDTLKQNYLSPQEEAFRAQEQKELNQHAMNQKVFVNSVTPSQGSELRVECDRLVSIGKVRSAFPLSLIVTLSKTNRSEGNPYGLLVEKVTELKPEASSDNPKSGS